MLDAVPDIEEQERMRYQMMETPKMDNAPENIEEELRKAPATDDLMMLFAPHSWTIYYAYLREEMEKHPELSLETDDEIQALDTEVMQDLYLCCSITTSSSATLTCAGSTRRCA